MKIAICDDNVEQRKYYEDLIKDVLNKLSCPGEIVKFDNGKQLLFEIEYPDEHPDILFLDINMPDINGIDVAQKLKEKNYQGEIIFLTGSDKYWRPAFDLNAYNYILKQDDPPERFEKVLRAAIEYVNEKGSEYMLFTSCGEIVNVAIKSIEYFESLKKIMIVHYAGKKFQFYSTMGKIEEQLFRHDFIRIHRSYFVSLQYIERVTYNSVYMKDGTKLPLGRTYQKKVKEILERKNIATN